MAKNEFFLLMALLLAVPQMVLADQPASEKSIRRLIVVTEMEKLLEGTAAQMDGYIESFMKQATGGRSPTPEQAALLTQMRSKMVKVMTDEMRWDRLEPQFVEIYRKSFTEAEVAGMLAFYQSPAGQAAIKKMPVVMQHSMAMMQQMTLNMTPKLKAIQDETVEKLRQCCEDGR